MSEYRIDVNKYWTPWEHEVCMLCLEDNPNAIWLVKVHCFKPHIHSTNKSSVYVVIDHQRMAMVAIRGVSTSLWRRSKFKMCYHGDICSRKLHCWFPHSQHEVNMWNIKNRLVKSRNRMLVSQLCNASLKSQSPSEVCRICFEANPKAVWLAWLKCTNTAVHKNTSTVTVVVSGEKGSSFQHAIRHEKKLVKVRSLPYLFTQIDQVKLCGSGSNRCSESCQRAHSDEELIYWKWQVARKFLFENYSDFSRLNDEYEYPSEGSSIISDVVSQKLTENNYHSKYHKLIYLEEIESSRKIILECDSNDVTVRVEWCQGEKRFTGLLKGLSYSAMDYASFNRAEIVISFQDGHQTYTTSVLDTPDYEREAILLRTIPSNLQPSRQAPLLHYAEHKASAHFDINHNHYHHQHQSIENADESILRKVFPNHVREGHSGKRNANVLSINTFPLDEQYQLTALKKIFSCSPDAPYLLLGPFGTGKTYLLAAAVAKLVEINGNRVLVCTHRNRGADGIYRTLQGKIKRANQSIARMVGSADAMERVRLLPGPALVTPDKKAVGYSALVTTFGVAGNLVQLVRQGQMCFSHILIDEGAQCPEPEALGALVLADHKTKIIIVGDNKQVGPKVRVLSEKARDSGLGESVLERLFSYYKTEKHCSLTTTHTSSLLTNYRCHPSILMLASSLFYECTLLSQTKRETHPKAPYPLVFACTSLKQDNYCNCPPENEEEAILIISQLVEFAKTWPTPLKEQIGVLASTKQQVACLRKHWKLNKLKVAHGARNKVVILPTYNIQGEEFCAVFLSTAEPTDNCGAPMDQFKSICNKYVFNTVITRPQSLIFVAGNPFSLLQMGSHFEINCWMEYIRRCIQCQSFIPPKVHSPSEAQQLPELVGQVGEKVLLGETIQQVEDQKLNSKDLDRIVERYISDLDERREYKLAAQLVQSPSGDISWETERSSERSTRRGVVWCQLDCKDFRNAVAKPLGNDSSQEDIRLNTAGVLGPRGAFHGSEVKVDIIRKCVLFDEETEQALKNTHFGASFACRVDPKNPVLFFPLDQRYPKFANLPMLLVEDRNGVICFDPNTINSTPRVCNFIPLEVAAKIIFIVKFLGWQSRFPYPLGIIVAALPPGNSSYTGELALRISNNIPITPCPAQLPRAVNQSDSSACRTFTCAFTIDPDCSPDHDAALTCRLERSTARGDEYEIGVHITNVQHYVQKDSEMDREACKRGRAVYHSPNKCMNYMLPKAQVRETLSISEGKSTRTLSVVATYLIGKDGIVKEVQNSVQFLDSRVHCSLQLSHQEAHRILCRELKFPNDRNTDAKIARYNRSGHLKIEDQLLPLWKIAMFIRQKRLGKEAAYSFLLDEAMKKNCPEPHHLVEELMTWANCQVAIKLLEVFPGHTVLRVQGKPREGEISRLQQQHGATLAASLGLRNYAPPNQPPLDEIQILCSTNQEIKNCLDRALIRYALHYVQFEQLHPQMAVATVDAHRCEKSKYIVSTAGRKEYWHNDLQCDQYTHFTSPIRCYIDIVVQRLLNAGIHRKQCPYSQEELSDICSQSNEALKNSEGYNNDVKRLALATNLRDVSQVYVSFVQQITEDAEIELTFADPELKVLHERERLIALKHLKALSIPLNTGQKLPPRVANPNSSPRSPQLPADDVAVWQVKIASFNGTLENFFLNPQIQIIESHPLLLGNRKRYAEITLFTPEEDIVSENSTVKERKLNAHIRPYTHTVSQNNWAKLQNIAIRFDASELQDPDSVADDILSAFGFQDQSSSHKPPAVTTSPSPLLIYKLHRPIQASEVLNVHLTASPLNFVLAPSLQLLEVGPELRICIQHNTNPAECFADRIVEQASKREYRSIEEYFRCWEQVLLSEAVSESLSDSELLIVKDVTLKWPELEYVCDSFGQVTYKLNIPHGQKEAGVVMELPRSFLKMSYEFFKFGIGDLLCVRYDALKKGKRFGFTFHMVIHHAEMERKTIESISVVEKATFYLKFVGQSSNCISPEVAKLLQGQTTGVTVHCEVQLLPLTLPFRRIYGCLHDLRLETGISNLARKIALGTAKTTKRPQSITSILTQEELSVATMLWPVQDASRGGIPNKLNRFQTEALDLANGNHFTLIQGPPGTGKTVTGAHLAYVLARKLHRERLSSTSSLVSRNSVDNQELKPCIMYCGPSNQAVNVVLNILTEQNSPVKDKLKILRVFSKTIEQEQYPGPKLHEQVFRKFTSSDKSNSKCEPWCKPFALHELVRKACPRIAEMDAEFKELQRQGKVASQTKRREYYQLISKVEKTILRENVDIVLCTCNEASSRRIRMTLKPVYCIIDECAMSTEPECMVPIQRAENVILIGDHQQLQPVIRNHVAEVKGLGTSLFERYVEDEKYAQLQKPHMLKLQYRMHPELCRLPSELFYMGELETDESVTTSRLRTPEAHLKFWPEGENKPFVFVDIVGRERSEHTGQRGKEKVGEGSKFNSDEAEKIATIASVLVSQYQVKQNQIAALTPYSAQKEEIKRFLNANKVPNIKVKTVKESQGSEYGIVLLSTVRSKPVRELKLGDDNKERKNADIGWIMKNLGFLTDSHQICVGITRCKYGLVIVGNKTLLSYNDTWRKIIDHYAQNQCIRNESNFP